MEKQKDIGKLQELFLKKIKTAIKSDRRPSGYYYNNRTNKEHWKGAKQGWKDCIDYIVDLGELDEEFDKIFYWLVKKLKQGVRNSSHD